MSGEDEEAGEDPLEADDWFERALDEADEPDGSNGDGAAGDAPRDGDVVAEPTPEARAETPTDGSVDRPDVEDSGAGAGETRAGDADDADLFTNEFAAAFEDAPTPDGPADDPLTAEPAFEEEYDTDIPRIDIGIEGLDSMIQGGVPERSIMVVIGDAGSGKTTFGLQFLRHGLRNGENGVFIALEEEYDRVVSTADDRGWAFSEYIQRGQLAVIDIDPIEMANSLTSIGNELPDLVREFGASRLVLDSVSLLEMMYEDQADRRTQVYDFTKGLKRAGVTTMLTSEASEEDPTHSRFGTIEYLTDAVFVLRYIRPEDFRETRLAIEIQKIRESNHSRETKPYEITNDGINVYRQANIF